MSETWIIREPTRADGDAWGGLRVALWPDEDADVLRQEVHDYFARERRDTVFLAVDKSNAVVGFAEATIRNDYVNGTETSPVGFLEGIFVAEHVRRSGVGRALVDAVEAWAREQGCEEFASDALIDNDASHAAHHAYGFEETERVVYFRKRL